MTIRHAILFAIEFMIVHPYLKPIRTEILHVFIHIHFCVVWRFSCGSDGIAELISESALVERPAGTVRVVTIIGIGYFGTFIFSVNLGFLIDIAIWERTLLGFTAAVLRHLDLEVIRFIVVG